MAPTPVNRRLVAVLAADAVSYSKLMSENEEGTLRVLAAHRSVIDGIIEFHSGRIFKTAGDSVLAEFASSVDAVRCALEIQDALKTRNDSLPEEQRLLFRIGVNLGDVVVKDEDLLGDGVNIAARLESIAEPGCVCISSAVYDQVIGKLSLGFVDLGEKELKNISRPVHVFGLAPGKGMNARPASTPRSSSLGRWLGITAAIGALLAGGSILLPKIKPQPPVPSAGNEQASGVQHHEEREKLLWDTVRSSNNPAELEAYLKQYPAGMFSDVARARIESLRKAALSPVKAVEVAPAKRPATAEPVKPAPVVAPVVASRPVEQHLAKPAPEASRIPVQPKAAQNFDGSWNVLVNCDKWKETEGILRTFPTKISQNIVKIERGKSDRAGYIKLDGKIQDNGTLTLTGHTLSVHPQFLGRPVTGTFTGKFSGDYYEGKGAFGSRPCTLTLVRK